MSKIRRKFVDLDFNSSESLRAQDIPYDDTLDIKTKIDTLTGVTGYFVDLLDVDASYGSPLGEDAGRIIQISDTGDKLEFGPKLVPAFDALGEPTGFPNRVDSQISWGISTTPGKGVEFTIEPTGVSFEYFIKGEQYIVTTPQVIELDDDEGVHFIYFDSAGNLTSTQTIVDFLTFFTNNAYVAYVYWDEEHKQPITIAEERHGTIMDEHTHVYLHVTRGAAYGSGLSFAPSIAIGTNSPIGNDDLEVQGSIENGSMWDEDILISIFHSSMIPTPNHGQWLTPDLRAPVLYQRWNSSLSKNTWHRNIPDPFSNASYEKLPFLVMPYRILPDTGITRLRVNNYAFSAPYWEATVDEDISTLGITGEMRLFDIGATPPAQQFWRIQGISTGGGVGNHIIKLYNDAGLSPGDYVDITNKPAYNYDPGTNEFELAEVPDGKYFAMWALSTNCIECPIVLFMGQRIDDTLVEARDNNLFGNFLFGDFPFQEMKILYRLIFVSGELFQNQTKASLVDIEDQRNVTSFPSTEFIPSAHGALTGRGAVGSHPAEAISVDPSTFNNLILTTATNDVQVALELLDDHNHPIDASLYELNDVDREQGSPLSIVDPYEGLANKYLMVAPNEQEIVFRDITFPVQTYAALTDTPNNTGLNPDGAYDTSGRISINPTNHSVLAVNGTNAVIKIDPDSITGINTFLELTDTPSSYTTHSGKYLIVNGTTIDFTDVVDANYLQSRFVKDVVPTDGQILTWDGVGSPQGWYPDDPPSGGSGVSHFINLLDTPGTWDDYGAIPQINHPDASAGHPKLEWGTNTQADKVVENFIVDEDSVGVVDNGLFNGVVPAVDFPPDQDGKVWGSFLLPDGWYPGFNIEVYFEYAFQGVVGSPFSSIQYSIFWYIIHDGESIGVSADNIVTTNLAVIDTEKRYIELVSDEIENPDLLSPQTLQEHDRIVFKFQRSGTSVSDDYGGVFQLISVKFRRVAPGGGGGGG